MELDHLPVGTETDIFNSKYDKYFTPDIIREVCVKFSICELLIWVSVNDRYSKVKNYVDSELMSYFESSGYDFTFPRLSDEAYRIASKFYIDRKLYDDRIHWVDRLRHVTRSKDVKKCPLPESGTFIRLSPYVCTIDSKLPVIAQNRSIFMSKFGEDTEYCLVTLSQDHLSIQLWPALITGNQYRLVDSLRGNICYTESLQTLSFLKPVTPQDKPMYFFVRSNPMGDSDFIPIDPEYLVHKPGEDPLTIDQVFANTKFDTKFIEL